jgi:hypothetical protein
LSFPFAVITLTLTSAIFNVIILSFRKKALDKILPIANKTMKNKNLSPSMGPSNKPSQLIKTPLKSSNK